MYPTREQEQALLAHCGHARYVWNLAVEQLGYRTRGQMSNADLNTARNIAAGRAVTARGAAGMPTAVNREPQHRAPLPRWRSGRNPPPSGGGGRQRSPSPARPGRVITSTSAAPIRARGPITGSTHSRSGGTSGTARRRSAPAEQR
nr:helix-turn-helix domain-containing protein [Pseudonocardia asaccharolytica]